MEGSSRGSSSSPAPFLVKTYEMVDDPSTNSIVSWSPTNASFVVWKQMEFSRDLLPAYFKHNNFSSFVRQLNTYGFRKIDPDQWEFANDDFIRGRKHLLKNIHRRKPVHSHSLSTQPLLEAGKQELEEEIERLKQEKRRLWNELQRHKQQQHGMECQMQSLEERLQVLGNRQRALMAFLARIIQKPSFLSNLVQQHSDLRSKKRRLPKNDNFNEDTFMEDNQIESPQSTSREYAFDTEPFEKMESSLNSLENFFRDVSRASGDDLPYDSIVPSSNSNVIFTEINASSGETAANLQTQLSTMHPSSPSPGDIQSPPEIQESTNYAPAPDPATEKQAYSDSRFSEIDVNSEPAATEVGSSRDRTAASTVATGGANDGFWEQFLTEMPGCDIKEGQSRNPEDKQSSGRMGNLESTFWNRKYLYHFAEKIENLVSTEKT